MEYKAFLVRLQLAKVVGAMNLNIFSDLQLLVKQVNSYYQVKREKITSYLAKVKSLLSSFKGWQIMQVLEALNAKVDYPAKLD